jgi:hypothetical protein
MTSSNAAAPQSSTSSTPAATTTTAVVHTVDLDISMSNLDSYADETALVNKIKEGLAAVAESGAAVTVVIQSIQVTTVYGNLPQVIVDDIAQAVKAMSSVPLSQITVNGQRHSSVTRRLSESATVITTVNNTGGVDVVAEMKRIHGTQTAAAFSTQLQAVNTTAYQSVSASLDSAPTISVQASSTVAGVSTAPVVSQVVASVANVTNGTVSATVTPHGATPSPSPSPSPTSTSRSYVPDGDDAPIAPMMTLWAVAYAFATN